MKNKFRIIYRNLRMVYLRKKLKLTKVHKTFYMGGKSFVSSDLKAGFYSYIGPNCILYKKVEIGNYSMLANDVSIIGADHNYNQITKRPLNFLIRFYLLVFLKHYYFYLKIFEDFIKYSQRI